MELKAYLETFKKYYLLIGLFTVIGAIIAFTYVAKTPAGSRIDQTFYVATQPKNLGQAPATELDTYTQNQNARNFTDTATALAQSPDFSQAFVKSGQSLQVRKLAPQIIKVTATSQNSQESQNLLKSFEIELNQKIATLDPAAGVSIKSIGQTPSAYSTKLNRKIIILFGAFMGFVFAVFTSGLKTYFKL